MRRLAAIGIVTVAAGVAATSGAVAAWLADRLLHADDRPVRGADDFDVAAAMTRMPEAHPTQSWFAVVDHLPRFTS